MGEAGVSDEVELRAGQAWVHGSDDRVWLVVERFDTGEVGSEVRWRMVALDDPTAFRVRGVDEAVLFLQLGGWRRVS